MKQRESLERILFISRVREAFVPKVHETIEAGFPQAAFERVGLVGFTAYVGGGYCALELGYNAKAGFEAVFDRAAKDPEVRAFLEALGRYIEPPPLIRPGATATAPLAADVFLWRKESGVTIREPRPGHRPPPHRRPPTPQA